MFIFYILLKPSLIFICVHKYVFFKKYCLIFLFFWIDIKEAQDYSMLHVKTVYNITPCQASQHAPLPLLPSQKTRSYNNVLPYPLPFPKYLMQALINYGQVRIDPISFDAFTLHTDLTLYLIRSWTTFSITY